MSGMYCSFLEALAALETVADIGRSDATSASER
jgi:hypothetical protein